MFFCGSPVVFICGENEVLGKLRENRKGDEILDLEVGVRRQKKTKEITV